MKRLFTLLILFLVFSNAQNYQKKVEDINNTKQETKNEAEFINSILYKLKFSTKKDYKKEIKNLTRNIENSNKISTKLILKSILAQLYSNFLKEYRYRLENITYMDDENNNNIYTWSIKKVNNKIKHLYLQSLDIEAQSIPITDYKSILANTKNSNNLLPTLYDFLAFRALDYFQNNNNLDIDYFYINQKEAFGTINQFITYDFNKINQNSPKYQALLIYQKLLKFHKKRKDTKTLAYINLKRLKFVYKYFVPNNRDKYYLNALKSLDSQQIDSQALYLAEYYLKKSEYKKALNYAKKGIKSKDKYISNSCYNIKNRITSKYLGISIESINLPKENILAKINYKNIDKIFIKVIKTENKKQTIVNDFNISIPKTDDYKIHSTEISLGNYDFGNYLFILSTDKFFQQNTIYYSTKVSKIAYFSKNSEILILNRKTGTPIKSAKVKFFDNKNNLITTLKSNNQGLVKIPKILKLYSIQIENGKDILDVKNNIMYYNKISDEKEKIEEKIYFFTDKAIYSPSQNINFKGLLVKKSSIKEPKIIPNKKVEVSLYSNNQKIKSKIFKTDEFGSFYGSFQIPKNIKGDIELKSNLGYKTVAIRVYQKPKFEILFDKLDKNYKIGDRVTIKGKIKTYNGSKVKAKVLYHINRVAYFPYLDWRIKQKPITSTKLIDMGQINLNKDGSFNIKFIASTDKSIPTKYKALFHYQISIEIIDNKKIKESKSEIINIGFTDIIADIIVDKELNKNNAKIVKIDSQDINGGYIPIKGEISIEKLEPQKKIYRKRYWNNIDKPLYTKEQFKKLFPNYNVNQNKKIKIDKVIKTVKFDTKKSKEINLGNLEQGEYQLTLYTQDKYGTKIQKSKKIVVYDINQKRPPYPTYLWQKTDKKSYQVGSTAIIYIKSSLNNAKIFFTLYKNNKNIKEEWIDINGSIEKSIPITKDDRGDIFYTIILVKNNRNYTQRGTIKVPYNNKLKVKYISFSDNIKPNSKEQYKIKISTKDNTETIAQMVATIYDNSLDNLISNSFNIKNLYPKHYIKHYNRWRGNYFYANHKSIKQEYSYKNIKRVLPHLKLDIKNNKISIYHKKSNTPITIKKSLHNTIFFKPNLISDTNGTIVINFKTNQDIAKWRFLGFIHTKDLKTAITQRDIVTKKELIVNSILPKYIRENDTIVISEKISNMSDRDLKGNCKVELINPITHKKIYSDKNLTKTFSLKKGLSTIIDFSFKVPTVNKVSILTHKVTVETDNYKDTKKTNIPILSHRDFITKNKTLYLKAKEEKTFTLNALRDSNLSTITNYRLITEFTSNPAWYALQSMPYVMEYPSEDSQNLFNKYFITSIAIKLLRVSPKIEQILKEWRIEDKKEQQLKPTIFYNAPWILGNLTRKEQLQQIAILFDINRLKEKQQRAYNELIKRQFRHYDGGWSWFKGAKSDWKTTQYIVKGFGELKQFGIDKTKTEAMGVATAFMDKQIKKEYNRLLQQVKKGETTLERDHINNMIIEYLYARSFYDFPILCKEAYKYYITQAKKYWYNKTLYQQAMIAIALHKNLDKEEAISIIKSIKKQAIINKDEIYFKYPKNIIDIKAHTMIMYLFKTIAKDDKIVKSMKVWLLKNRDIYNWKTPQATTDAIYALLFNNAWILNRDKLVTVEFPKTTIDYKSTIEKAKKSTPKGIGSFYISFKKFDKNMATIKVKNPNDNAIWGNIYWQYFQDKNKTKNINTSFEIEKRLYIIKENKIEKKLIPIEKSSLQIGDIIEVKLKIKVKKDTNYILLKDEIPSAFKPTNIVNEYKYQNNLVFFENIKNSTADFYFENLPKGEYIFKYTLLVSYKGEFYSGIATIKKLFNPKIRNYTSQFKFKVER